MKKIILTVLVALLLMSTAFAASAGAIQKYIQVKQNQQNPVATNGQEQLYEEKVTGLQNAMLRVRNEEQRQHLQNVLDMIQEKARARLQHMEDLVIALDENSGKAVAVGVRRVYLLGIFPVKKQWQYTIEEDGEMMRKNVGLDFLYGENSILNQEE
jgi:hypothetical protein